ncbi:MAG TPA: MBOAT family O-acyltransferase, partial [Candidatus Cloacimonadota bacterium]|nr:MBOAT family O-acyltransferase [Candidatus Cloacimonadota bacterium]
LPGNRYKRYVLTIASLAFYVIGQKSYIFFLLVSVAVNFLAGLSFQRFPKAKKPLFILSLVFNVGLLLYFKYVGYWLGLINPSLHILSGTTVDYLQHLILPIGISFFTFNAIGYTIDVYLQVTKPEKNIVNYFVYQSFFPQVLSGPVARSRKLLPQIMKPHELDYDNIVSGLRLILFGYFKKIVIANGLRTYVTAGFDNYTFHNGTTLLFASVLFFCQLYADFSGYTDVALGTARLFGYNLIANFNKPLFSNSVTDFWRRWHISLSSWVRDYMYYPLYYSLRNKKEIAFLVSTLVTFFIIGMWHGPKANFAIFGLLMFVFITIENYSTKYFTLEWGKLTKLVNLFKVLFTFMLMSLCLMFLRADTVGQVREMIIRIFTSSGRLFFPKEATFLYGLAGMILLLVAEIASKEDEFTVFLKKLQRYQRWIVYILMICILLICGSFNDKDFIYYQF